MRIASLASAVFSAALALSLARAASAQGGPPPYGPPITLAAATKVMEAAMTEGKKLNLRMVVTIVDSGANVVMLHRMDDAQLGGIDVATNKAMTAVKLKRPTKAIHDVMAQGGSGLRMLVLMPGIAPVDGGVPIVHEGKIVGAIGISGGTQEQDGQVAKSAAEALGK